MIFIIIIIILYWLTASFSFILSLAAFQLLNGRVEDDEIPEEYCGLEGSTVQEQLTIVSSRLDQREADYDSLKSELNKTKEECINLQGSQIFWLKNLSLIPIWRFLDLYITWRFWETLSYLIQRISLIIIVLNFDCFNNIVSSMSLSDHSYF